MRKVYATIQWLSLDVAFGALASGSMVAWWWDIEMPWSWWLSLPLAVWVVYTADHLLDAWRLKEEASTDRHRFHYQYGILLVVMCGLGAFVGLFVMPFFLPIQIIYMGVVIGGLVLVHLLLVKVIGNRISLLFQKEIGVGLIYTLGIWGGPWVMGSMNVAWEDAILLGQYFLLVMMNLLLFSIYELEVDEQDGHTSFVRALGMPYSQKIVNMLGIFTLILGLGVLIFTEEWLRILPVELCYLSMGSLLMFINLFPHIFKPLERYRLYGDLVFIFPIIFLFL